MMNYEEADSVKGLAPGVNKVLEGLEIECPNCHGKTLVSIGKDFKGEKAECPFCWGKKVKYKWQPKVGEWCIHKEGNMPSHITGLFGDEINNSKYMRLILGVNAIEVSIEDYLPILHWEEIEGVLKQAGIGFDWFYPADGVEIEMWWKEDNPNQDPCVIIKLIENESRQKAVMKAVIELGKEI